MKKSVVVIMCLLSLVGIALCVGCSASGINPQMTIGNGQEMELGYKSITSSEAKRMMDTQDVTVVDVRATYEYNEAHVAGALSIPNESIEADRPAELPDLDATLLLYCRTGVRSKQAAEKLVTLGYTNVYEFGGIRDWSYETERTSATPTS